MAVADEEQQLIDAVRRAAATLRTRGPLPPRSEDVMRFAVRDEIRQAVVDVAHEAASITADWTPLPGRLDLHAPRERPLRWAAEVKVWDIGQQIWDALKLTAGITAEDLRTGYLLTAACPSAFAADDGHELYAPGSHEHIVTELIRVNARAWKRDLGGGSGRPTTVPSRFRTTLLFDGWCWFGHRLRLMRVEATADSRPLAFTDGWPESIDGPAAVAAAKRAARRGPTDALGLAVPARFSASWWEQALRAGATGDQFEALYGLLLTRNWTDAHLRARVRAPDGAAPPWWQ